MKKWIRNTALVLFGIIFALVLVEIGLRIIIGDRIDYDRVYHQYDPLVGHVHRPNLDFRIDFPEHPQGYFDLVTDDYGLREDETVPHQRSPGIGRILVLGDSHTDATVFNRESYPNVFETQLNTGGIDVEVLNAGVSDYDPLQELLWFHYYGRHYNPDLVILGVYVGNDLVEMTGFDDLEIVEGVLYLDGARHQPGSRRDAFSAFLDSSYLYSFLRWTILPAVSTAGNSDAHNESFRRCRGCYWQSLNQAARFSSGEIDLERALARFQNVLEVLDRLVRDTGADLYVILIPSKKQVEPVKHYTEAAEVLGLEEDDLDFDETVLASMLEICEKLGIPVINLKPALLEKSQQADEALYYETDWHLSPAGHAAIADILFGFFQEDLASYRAP